MYRWFYDGHGNLIFLGFFQMTEDYKPEAMTITNICKDADLYRNDYAKLSQIHNFLTANVKRFSEVEFSFAKEHIENYMTILEGRDRAEGLIKRTSGE